MAEKPKSTKIRLHPTITDIQDSEVNILPTMREIPQQ